MPANITLTETWKRSDWSNFDTAQGITSSLVLGRQGDGAVNNFGLETQQHVDIAVFVGSGWTGTGVTSGYTASLNHWPALTMVCGSGVNTATNTNLPAIDITPMGPNGKITLALPNFPVSNLDLTQCYLDLGTNGFGAQSCSLTLINSLTPLLSGNTTLTFAYASLTGVDPTNINSVRLRLTATSSCTVYAMALRYVSALWVPTNVDYDSRSGVLRRTIPLNGSTTAITPTNQSLPILWRSSALSGVDDPQPINSEFSFLFNTGSQSGNNIFTLYMRGNEESRVTQLDLQGKTQSQLTGKPQPFETTDDFIPRTLGDFDGLSLSRLDGVRLLDLERTNNTNATGSWVAFSLQWGTSPLIQVFNAANQNTYEFQFAPGAILSNNTTYTCICSLIDSQARVQLYSVNATTNALGSIIYDTGVIDDGFAFTRMPGRIGFRANLIDGDAYVGAVRPRNLMFAEYRSKPLQSIRPVRGARIYVQTSPDVELFSSWSSLADSNSVKPILATDQQRYIQTDPDSASTRVQVIAPSTVLPSQGVISNVLSPAGDNVSGITNFDQLHIQFSIWMPNAAFEGVGQSVLTAALLSSDGANIPIELPSLQADQWTKIEIMRPLPTPYPQSGLYQLILYYNGLSAITWWVDAVTVHEHSIRFDGRSVVDDPWRSNQAPWTFFHDTLNSDSDGVLFTTVGNSLQIRAQALWQDSTILSAPKIVPQYAQLGRFVWPEDAPTLASPVASFSSTNSGRTFTFDATTSSSANGRIGNYHWVFGDGTYGSGPVISHVYPSWVPSATTYLVNLYVIDTAGVITSALPDIITLP